MSELMFRLILFSYRLLLRGHPYNSWSQRRFTDYKIIPVGENGDWSAWCKNSSSISCVHITQRTLVLVFSSLKPRCFGVFSSPPPFSWQSYWVLTQTFLWDTQPNMFDVCLTVWDSSQQGQDASQNVEMVKSVMTDLKRLSGTGKPRPRSVVCIRP